MTTLVVAEVDVVLDGGIAGLGIEQVGPGLAVAARANRNALVPPTTAHLPDSHDLLVGPGTVRLLPL